MAVHLGAAVQPRDGHHDIVRTAGYGAADVFSRTNTRGKSTAGGNGLWLAKVISEQTADGRQQLETVYREHRGDVYRICYGLLKNRSDAEDAMQDTFVAAIRHLDVKQREPWEISKWLRVTAHNKSLRVLTKVDRRRLVYTDEMPDRSSGTVWEMTNWTWKNKRTRWTPKEYTQRQAIDFVAHICRSLVERFSAETGGTIQ